MHAGVGKVWSVSAARCKPVSHTCSGGGGGGRGRGVLAGKLGCKITRFRFLRFPDGRAEDTEVIKANFLCIKVEPGVTCSHEMT